MTESEPVETLSSSLTFAMKWVFSPFWIVTFGIGSIAALLDGLRSSDGSQAPALFRWLFPAIWVVGSTLLVKWTARLKRLRIRGDVFLVSNYRREITIPTSELREIIVHRYQRGQPITLKFARDSELGQEIVILPKKDFWNWRENRVTVLLERIAAQNRREAGTG